MSDIDTQGKKGKQIDWRTIPEDIVIEKEDLIKKDGSGDALTDLFRLRIEEEMAHIQDRLHIDGDGCLADVLEILGESA